MCMTCFAVYYCPVSKKLFYLLQSTKSEDYAQPDRTGLVERGQIVGIEKPTLKENTYLHYIRTHNCGLSYFPAAMWQYFEKTLDRSIKVC
jgi:hypothetical protein